jgi:hypothetical protein
MNHTLHRRWYLIAAVMIAVMTSAYGAWRLFDGEILGTHLVRLYGIAMFILVAAWINTDPAIPFKQRPSFDHAMLIWMSFPFLAAYHMFLAHRWRGFLMVLGLTGLIIMPAVVFALVDIFG